MARQKQAEYADNGDKPQETKAERFDRLAAARLSKAKNAIRQCGGLSAKGSYDYSEAAANLLCKGLIDAVQEVSDKFAGKVQRENPFTLLRSEGD
jgi:hypothetical protein